MAEKEVDIPKNFSEPFRKLCSHYSRGCSLVAPCCKKVYYCRVCHNEKEAHEIDRFAVKEIVCRNCEKHQKISKRCYNCSITFARYTCFKCNLFDDAEKGQYHCEKCGICRIGGKDNFFHCDTCGLCLQASLKEAHKCIQQASRSNCPVCMEDLHSSRTAAHVPKCGHLLHNTCFQDMIRNNLYQCPQCQTSLIDMSSQWEALDEERAQWVLPFELRNFKVKIQCRDCRKEDNTDFHFVGLKCLTCGSYNTVRCGNETLPLDDVNPRQFIAQRNMHLPRVLNDSEEEEEEVEENNFLAMLENNLLRPLFGPLPDDHTTEEEYDLSDDDDDEEFEEFLDEYDNDYDEDEEDIMFHLYPPPFLPANLQPNLHPANDVREVERERRNRQPTAEVLQTAEGPFQVTGRGVRATADNTNRGEPQERGATANVTNNSASNSSRENSARQLFLNDYVELIETMPHILSMHDEESFLNFMNRDYQNTYMYYSDGQEDFDGVPFTREHLAAATHNNPRIWEIQEEEEEEEEVSDNKDSEGWETASEEEIVGGDEENLGKEECLIPEEEETSQLDDVAPAN